MKTVRKILVTGATSGIGRAVSARLLAEGHFVLGIGRDLAKLADDQAFAAASFTGISLNLADLDTLPSTLDDLAKAHRDIDAMVFSAGRGDLGGLEEFSYARIRAVLDLNLVSQIYLARAFLPAMKARGRGDVIFLGSEAAHRGGRRGTVYCASKFGLRGFAEALREECAKGGVRVTSVHPAMVRTPFFDELPIAPGERADEGLEAEDVAAAVLLALEARPGAVIDEIRISPLKKRVVFKN